MPIAVIKLLEIDYSGSKKPAPHDENYIKQ